MRTSASATSDGECVVPLCVDVFGGGRRDMYNECTVGSWSLTGVM